MRRATSAAGTSPEVRRGAKRARHALACSVPRAVNPSPSTHTTATSHPPVDREDPRLRLCALEFSTRGYRETMTVASTNHRTSPIHQILGTAPPVRVTRALQLTFGLVSPLSSLPRARKSSTTGTFYERDRHVAWTRTTWPSRWVVRDRTPARLPPPPHLDVPHMGPSHPTFPMLPLGMSKSHGGFHRHKFGKHRAVDSAAPAPLALARANLENFPSQILPARRLRCDITRLCLANNNERRITACPGLSRRMYA